MGLFSNKKQPLIERFDAVALADAVLCEQCKNITAAKNGHCPVCLSTALVNLSNTLNREENETLQTVRDLAAPRPRFRSARIFELVPRRR